MEMIDLENIWRRLICCFFILSISFANAYREGSRSGFGFGNRHRVTYNYDRIDEVNKACETVMSSATEFKPDENRLYSIKEELSFSNGDWRQSGGDKASLMPFNDRDTPEGSLARESPMNLASFQLTDVDRAHRSKKSFLVSGSLLIGLTRQELFPRRIPFEEPHFNIWPGHSELFVSFQGIYMESNENGGERVVCLIGNAMLPAREPSSPDPWEWVKVSGYTNQPPLLQDDQILLVLHFPMTLTLTNREIHGRMTSLNPKSNLKYFDDVYISSWLGSSVDYEFSSEKLVTQACNPYPYTDNSTTDLVYKGSNICPILTSYSHGEFLSISPNWGCNISDEFCRKLGPFSSDYQIKTTDGGFKDVNLVLQDVRCQQEKSIQRISAVFRAVPPFENQYNAAQRTGLNNMTLSVEGIWKDSSGQLCMIGCNRNICNSRIILYFPLVFSIQQRSIIKGTISNIFDKTKNENSLFYPLSFEKIVSRSGELRDMYTSAHPYYRYSKIDSAATVMEKNQPYNFGDIIKKSFLNFPRLITTDSYQTSLSYLSEDLTLQTSAFHYPIKTGIQMEIISIGQTSFWTSLNRTIFSDIPYHEEEEYTEKQLLLNISARLKLNGDSKWNFSSIFLEGLYDQHVGKMYLIGCRDVHASWMILSESNDLENGLDCLIEVVIAYPPTSTLWLSNPSATISISSKRNEDDPLYFKPVSLQTYPVMYRKQREDMLSRTSLEGILRMITLSIAIGCIVSQLFYIRDNANYHSVPYISLTMILAQLIGYTLSLVTGVEAIFKKMSFENYGNSYITIGYIVKFLVLVSLLLTLYLLQRVWKSRAKLLSRSPQEANHVPGEKWVFLSTLIVHGIVYIIILMKTSPPKQPRSDTTVMMDYWNGNNKKWEIELEKIIGLIQDWFLLPQIIGNFIWQIHCRPLRKLYFIGITIVRILPHVYDHLKPPFANPYFSEESEFVNPSMDFYTRFGDAAIPATAILLGVIVFIQQRWNYEELSRRLVIGRLKLLPVCSRAYERLPSKASSETELVSGVGNGDGAKEKEKHGGSESDID